MTRNRHTLGLVVVAAMVVLAGCGMSEQVWGLSVHGAAEPVDDEWVFNGTVELGGMSTGVTVHDVRVTFLTANNTTIKTVHVGRFNRTDRRLENISVHLDQKPTYVHVTAGRIDSPEDARYGYSGLVLTDEGYYRPYYQANTTTHA